MHVWELCLDEFTKDEMVHIGSHHGGSIVIWRENRVCAGAEQPESFLLIHEQKHKCGDEV